MNSRGNNPVTIVSYLILYISVRTTLYIDLGWAVTSRLQVNNHDRKIIIATTGTTGTIIV